MSLALAQPKAAGKGMWGVGRGCMDDAFACVALEWEEMENARMSNEDVSLFSNAGDAKAERERKKRKEKQLRTKVKPKTPSEVHVTLVGDRGSSKTTLLKVGVAFLFFRSFSPLSFVLLGFRQSFAQDATRDFSGPFESVAYYVSVVGAKEKDKYLLRLFDTDSDELFSRIRAITYKTTDIFFVW